MCTDSKNVRARVSSYASSFLCPSLPPQRQHFAKMKRGEEISMEKSYLMPSIWPSESDAYAAPLGLQFCYIQLLPLKMIDERCNIKRLSVKVKSVRHRPRATFPPSTWKMMHESPPPSLSLCLSNCDKSTGESLEIDAWHQEISRRSRWGEKSYANKTKFIGNSHRYALKQK